MNNENLLFYHEYESFYEMADKSEVFKEYCEKAFGADFSQDGFSDLQEIEFILNMVKLDNHSKVLDIGCGNAKMLKYVQEKTGAYISGFDYSTKAIETAKKNANERSSFQVGTIGEIEYAQEQFDLITSMDTIYFAKNMKKFVSQIYTWLKTGGSFICGYQEGDIKKKSADADNSILAMALKANEINYEVFDYTKQTYDFLRKKKDVISKMRDNFEREGLSIWYKTVIDQTKCADVTFEEYIKENARYIYVIKKAA